MYELLPLTGTDAEGAEETLWARHVALRRTAQGQVPLYDAFQTLTHFREAHAQAAADLLERETWALTVIVNASEPIWTDPASPTLRFAIPGPERPAPYHLELGHFRHLAALAGPTQEEQALIAADSPCWARVCTDPKREQAGQTGALACAYTPLSTAEAVSILGFGRILTQIEFRTRVAGKALLAEAEEYDERQQRLLHVEQMLGWAPEADTQLGDATVHRRVLLTLLQDGSGKRFAAGTGLLGAMIAALSFVIGIPHALLLLLVVAPALLVWSYAMAA